MINTRVHKMTQNMTEQEMKARGIDPSKVDAIVTIHWQASEGGSKV